MVTFLCGSVAGEGGSVAGRQLSLHGPGKPGEATAVIPKGHFKEKRWISIMAVGSLSVSIVRSGGSRLVR